MPGVTTAYQAGNHAGLPAASSGCILYACSTHAKVYRSDGSAWSDWLVISTGMTNPLTTTGDLIYGVSTTPTRLAAGSAGFVLTSGGAGTAPSWAAPAASSGTLIAVQQYAPVADGSWTRLTGSLADVDATNAAVTFTAPASGNVLIKASFFYNISHANRVGQIGLRVASSNVAGPYQVAYNATTIGYSWVEATFYVTGLTPTTSYTYKLAFMGDGTATISIYYGPVTAASNPPFVMTVWAAP